MNSDSKNNFNRTLSLILPYRKKDLKLSVLFNKHNTYTAYHIDQVVYHSLKQRNTLQIFFDIRKSQFCNTFFDCNDLHDEGCNIQNNFNGIFTQYKDIMYYDSKESIVLDKVLYGNSFLENKIDINIIRLYKFQNDFLLCLCQFTSLYIIIKLIIRIRRSNL